MAEEKINDESTQEKDVSEMTPEEKAEAWSNWVISEVNAALGVYLPISKSGNIGVKYKSHVAEMQEGGPVYDDSKADGVLISVYFDFEAPIDLTKPRTESE